MKEKYLPNKKYYNFSTNCTCGVVVDEKTMKKIQKVLYKAESEIKNILHNSDDVRPYSWSLVNIMEGDKIKKQRTFHYADYDPFWNVKDRINELKLTTPKFMKDFMKLHQIKNLRILKNVYLKNYKRKSCKRRRKMTKSEKNKIIKWTNTLTDEELEKEYYDAVFDTLGSQAEEMYERGWDMQDVIEREKYEKWLGQKCDLLEQLCYGRGVKLWEI